MVKDNSDSEERKPAAALSYELWSTGWNEK